MTPAPGRVDTGIWSVPGHGTVIEYSRPVLNSILQHVVDSYESYLSGGHEVGGVLYGTHTPKGVRIEAFRTLEINPPRPSFVLAAKDEANLAQLLEAPKHEGELEGMEPVGWYHSHTRSEVFLSESDLDLYETYFPEPWQIAIVFRPAQGEPVRAGFFFREADGFIRADQSYQEVAFDPPTRRLRAPARAAWTINDQGLPVEPTLSMLDKAARAPAPAPAPAPEPVPPPEQTPAIDRVAPIPPSAVAKRERQPSSRAGWIFAAALAVVTALGVTYLRSQQIPDPALGLNVLVREGDLLIRWDPQSPALEDAQGGMLFIVDGSRRLDRVLTPAQLRRASETYRHSSSRVDVRLQISRGWGRNLQEIAAYIAHPDRGKPSPELLEARQELQDVEAELNRLRAGATEEARETERLQARLAELELRKEQLTIARQAPERARPFSTVKQPPPPAPVERDLPNAPALDSRPVAGVVLPQSDVRLTPPVAAPPPPPAPKPTPPPAAETPKPAPPPVVEAPKPAPRPATPTSGRFLWSGDLSRNSSLVIDGRNASAGAITGELPGVPVHVGAYPAEFAGDVLRVYTANPRYASQPRVDPPSAGNGWNKTQYLYDERAARNLIVEQAPTASNAKRMVVRAGARNLSVILIEWQVSGQ